MKYLGYRYVVYFEERGYYAHNQTQPYWSFTLDLEHAKMYKTRKGAENLIEHASQTMDYRKLESEIIQVALTQNIVIV